MGVLDSIGEQIEQDLSQFGRVGQQCRQVGGQERRDLDLLFARSGLGHRDDGDEHRAQFHRLQVEFEFARFDLGEVEDVVDEAEQCLRAREDAAEKTLLLLGHLAGHSGEH